MKSMIEKCCGTVFDLTKHKSLMEIYLWFHLKNTSYLLFQNEKGEVSLLQKKTLDDYFDHESKKPNLKKSVDSFLESPVQILSPELTVGDVYEVFASKDSIKAVVLGDQEATPYKGVITKQMFYNFMKQKGVSSEFMQKSFLPFFEKMS